MSKTPSPGNAGAVKLCYFIDHSGLTQVQFAERMGVTPGAVCNWCSGKSKPKPERIQQIERITKGLVKFHDWFPPKSGKVIRETRCFS